MHDSCNDNALETLCEVKVKHADEWVKLKTKEGSNSFLKICPDLTATPETKTDPPDNILEVNRHLNSVEERIGDISKVRDLRDLRDRVYRRREVPFHWELGSTFEENGDYQNASSVNSSDEEEEGEADVGPKFEYEAGCFIAVKTNRHESCKFWIARILRNYANGSLLVRWYIVRGTQDEFTGQYEVAKRPLGSDFAPYDAVLDPKMVLVYFDSLSRKGTLRAQTQSALRTVLDCS